MNKIINAVQIGGLAKKALEAGKTGKVLGITSKGMFIDSGGKIIFLTEADFRSPYNIQVRHFEFLSNQFNTGDECYPENTSINFPRAQITINMQQTVIWQPMPPPEITCSQQEQIARVDRIVRRMQEIDPNKGWLFLGNSGPPALDDLNSINYTISKKTLAFMKAFGNNDLPGCLIAAQSIIGLGGGLTPSGDDWLTGFLLLHARFDQSKYLEQPFVVNLGKLLIAMAAQKTTSISTNRIEAAWQGWAEEIFLDLINHLFRVENEFADSKIKLIMNFGHSSGVDTCMGIFAALTIQNQNY